MRAASSRSEVVGRRDLVVLSSSVSDGSEVSAASAEEEGVVSEVEGSSERRRGSCEISGEIEVTFSGGDEVYVEYVERKGDGGEDCLAKVGDAGVDPET